MSSSGHGSRGGILSTMDTGSASRCGSMHALFIAQLRHLYANELGLRGALMSVQPHSERLRDACQRRRVAAGHAARRLEHIFDSLSLRARPEPSTAMDALLAVPRGGDGDPTVRDAAVIAWLQTLEHCGIAGYGTARTWALHLTLPHPAELLQTSLDEARAADRGYTAIAESGINAVAADTADIVPLPIG